MAVTVSLNGSVPSPAPYPLAAGRVGASVPVFYALAAAAPITIGTTVIPAAYADGDISAVPLALLTVGLILLLFCVGYAAMARRVPNAGALYSFVARGLGRPIGVGAAWVALLSYNAIQIGLYGAAGWAAAPLLKSWFGIDGEGWMVAAGWWAVVALCGLLQVQIAGGLLALVVLAESVAIAGFGAANLLEPAGGRVTWDTFVLPDLAAGDRPALGLLLVVAAFAFIGFETTAAYAEETIRPRRSIARAAGLAVLLMALLYGFSAWAMSVAAGLGEAARPGAGRGAELVFDLAAARLAPWAVTLGRVLLLTGLLAAMISLHHTIARYTFALGRERVLFGWLGRTTRIGSVPVPASITQSLVAAAVLGGVYASGWGTPAETLHRLTVAGGLGILLLLPAASLAALLYLNRVPGDERLWHRFAAPAAATVLLGALAYLGWANLPGLFDVPADHPLVIGVPTGFAATVLFGISYGYVLRAVAPISYAGIGLGGAAVVVTPVIPRPREPGAHRPERVRR